MPPWQLHWQPLLRLPKAGQVRKPEPQQSPGAACLRLILRGWPLLPGRAAARCTLSKDVNDTLFLLFAAFGSQSACAGYISPGNKSGSWPSRSWHLRHVHFAARRQNLCRDVEICVRL